MLEFLKTPFLLLHLPYGMLMTFLMISVVLLSMLINYFTQYSRCGQTSDLWQQLELASGLESELRDAIDWGRK